MDSERKRELGEETALGENEPRCPNCRTFLAIDEIPKDNVVVEHFFFCPECNFELKGDLD